MITVKLDGRMGHQMLLYATAVMKSPDEDIFLDILGFRDKYYDYVLDKFNIPQNISLHINNGDDIKIIDDWTIPELKYKEILQHHFQINHRMTDIQRALLNDIKSFNSVAVHVRRGDFTTTHAKMRKDIATLEYYMAGLQLIKNYIPDCKIFVFSDDIQWCKDNLNIDAVFVEDNPAHVDWWLMRHCKHFIIANSSFSWWAAWLSDNPNKIVICPSRWRNTDIVSEKNLILDEWIKIDSEGNEC